MTAPNMELRRPKEGLPTEAEYYYGKPKGYDYPISPLNVKLSLATNELFVWLDPKLIVPIAQFDWYGKVPTCVESKT